MGHDIRAILPPQTTVAHLRLQERIGANSNLYNVLDSAECNATNSGNGTIKEFTQTQILKAIKSQYLSKEEKQFLNSIKNFDHIKIEFA